MPEVMLRGPAGRIEGRYHAGKKGGPLALVLHPNPEHGGDMNHNVAYLLYRVFVDLGFSVLRFNFRGVGRSEGTSGDGELDDASACLNWLCAHNPNASTCFVGGYSFGAWVGMQLLMRRPEIQRFVSISPPANLYDFSFLAPCPKPGLVVQGGQDGLVPKESVTRLVTRLKVQKSTDIDLKVIRAADHSFTGFLKDMFQITKRYVQENTPELP
ncbi:alpha/beta hydrolase [Candidatus Hepatobacter penaei]|uniref:alpha/beta hydrolase n=1 Tax=Candidatus Hepatobacter penaei TaxID=1274402 RepID=UPI0004F331E0|nr:alpha/beta hydrolase [Candidatus Hepatobacter penaei]